MIFGGRAEAVLRLASLPSTRKDVVILRFFPFVAPRFFWLQRGRPVFSLSREALGPASLPPLLGDLFAHDAILKYELRLSLCSAIWCGCGF